MKTKLTAWIQRQTEHALLISNTRDAEKGTLTIWIPKSVVPYQRRFTPKNEDDPIKVHMEVSDWFYNKNKQLEHFKEGHV
ncbi:MAG: hypothetical protein ABW007_19045 [Chitinophagaceae bacterium]